MTRHGVADYGAKWRILSDYDGIAWRIMADFVGTMTVWCGGLWRKMADFVGLWGMNTLYIDCARGLCLVLFRFQSS